MPAPALVLFDLDDTLCDYSGARAGRLKGAFGNAFAASGMSIDNLDDLVAQSIAIHPHGSDHFADLLASHGVTDGELQQLAKRWYQQNRFLGLQLYADTITVMNQVRETPGVRSIGLVTNGPAEIQRDKIKMLKLEPHIDFAVISGEFGFEKPDAAIFSEAFRNGHADASDAIYVGDSPEFDIEGARAAGIREVWYNRNRVEWPLQTRAPQHVIYRLPDLLPILHDT